MRNGLLKLSAGLSFVAGIFLAILIGSETFMAPMLGLEAQLMGYAIALGYLLAGATTWALLTAVADIAEKLDIQS